ncbi:MAG: hypothetical protein LBJ00_14395 [Planctomycetaceae bacterium]|nr:hypothetical protein [Planctomycetaceae bacterium]
MVAVRHSFFRGGIYKTGGAIGVSLTRFVFAVALLVMLSSKVTSLYCFADDGLSSAPQTSQIPELRELEVSGPYCGIYSLIACFHIYGIEPDIEMLLTPDYVGSFQGSSDIELIKAAEAHGLYGKAYGGLTWQELQKAKFPMILHFRSSHADQKYNHWVAYLGAEGGKVRILDVPHELVTIPFAELMARWDGTAIIISDKQIGEQFLTPARIRYLWFVVFIFGGMFLIQQLFWDTSNEPSNAPTFTLRVKKGIFQTVFLLGSIFVVAVLYHSTSETGFLRNSAAVAEVTWRYYSIDIPELRS